jgi:hypothetical protein
VESTKLCPVCGAYWKCDCKPEEIARVQRREVERSALNQTHALLNLPSSDQAPDAIPNTGCQHDWSEALGVEVDEQLVSGETQVLVCRLCGLYSVEERSA